jgi:hypothetical protein
LRERETERTERQREIEGETETQSPRLMADEWINKCGAVGHYAAMKKNGARYHSHAVDLETVLLREKPDTKAAQSHSKYVKIHGGRSGRMAAGASGSG